jgi:hypothetical protein
LDLLSDKQKLEILKTLENEPEVWYALPLKWTLIYLSLSFLVYLGRDFQWIGTEKDSQPIWKESEQESRNEN